MVRLVVYAVCILSNISHKYIWVQSLQINSSANSCNNILHFGAIKSECFFGAGAPAGQRPGPPLHLSLFSFLVHWLPLSLLPVECRPNQCILQTWVVYKSHKKLYCSRIAKNTNILVS